MSTPLLHVLAGPNGSGKSTFARTVLIPITGLPFVNADVIAAERWPGDEERHAYEASRAAAAARDEALEVGRAFIAETVFSHPSKVDLIARALALGYLVELHVMLVPEDLAVARVDHRVRTGGHRVPESKIRERYARLWPLVAEAARMTQRATAYDTTLAARPFRPVARLLNGRPVGPADWPTWTPAPLRAITGPAA